MITQTIENEDNADRFIQKMCVEKKREEQFVRNNEYHKSREMKQYKKEEEGERDRGYMRVLAENEKRIKEKEEMLRLSLQKELRGTLDYQVSVKERINRYQFGESGVRKGGSRHKQDEEYLDLKREILEREQNLIARQTTSQGFFNSGCRKSKNIDQQVRKERIEEVEKSVELKLSQFRKINEITVGQIRDKLMNRERQATGNENLSPVYLNKRPDKVIREHVKCTDCAHVF